MWWTVPAPSNEVTAQSAQAIADRSADLAILPANVGASAEWPVVAIVRQNVMAFIVPAPATATPAPATPGEAKPSAKTEEAKETKGKKGAKEAKEAKTAKGKPNAKEAKNAKGEEGKSAKADDAEESELEKISQLAGRRVGIVTGNEANASLLNVVLTHYGVPADKVQISQIEPKNLASAIADNQVDALFVAGPAAGHAIGEAVAAATRNGVAPGFIEIVPGRRSRAARAHRRARSRYSMRPFPSFPITSVPAFALNSFR
jgi:hypothetical protein